MPINFRLTMSSLTLSMIFTGNITTWNDPIIRSENPGVTMPSQNITVVIRNQSFADTSIFSNALAPVDAYFNSTIGTGIQLMWPTARYSSWLYGDAGNADTYNAPIAKVLQTPYSITYSSYNGASDVQASIALMINKAGVINDCTATSLTVAATEKGVGSNINTWADCNNANSAAAWPICGYSYIM